MLKKNIPNFVNLSILSDHVVAHKSIPGTCQEGRLRLVGVPDDLADGVKGLIIVFEFEVVVVVVSGAIEHVAEHYKSL